jgi:DNA-binding transcriptional ArsR family regulator
MNGTEFRVLDAMSRRVSDPVSIRQLTAEIERESGSAYYPNIYRALSSLRKEGIVAMEKQGKASIPSLNFANYLLLDTLTEMELQKKREFLKKWPDTWGFFESLERELGDMPSVGSILLLDPERNAKLNRAEPLVLTEEKVKAQEGKVEKVTNEIGVRFNVRVDPLVVAGAELIERLRSPEKNPFKELLADMVVLHMPQKFWRLIRNAVVHGVRIKFDLDRTDPSKIGEKDMVHNLVKLGYRELGSETDGGQDFSVEYIISSALMGEDRRRIAAVPVLLAKNKVDYSLLVFLSQKYGFAEKLLGALVALIKVAPSREIERAVAGMSGSGVIPAKMDETHVRQALRLYGIRGR